MKAAQITARRKIEVIDVPEPDHLEDGEVKVDVEYISVCGSDIYLEYDAPLDEEEYPLAPGRPVHECAGTVVESRDPGYKAGERVIVIPRQAAGAAEYVVQKQDRIIRLPEWGGLDEWVMCQHSGTALFSAKKWGNAAGKRIAVLGQGGHRSVVHDVCRETGRCSDSGHRPRRVQVQEVPGIGRNRDDQRFE
jgi:D-arabinose 1-dehydrogenase-like Zn-dependent alcohol dehydrogenase